MSIYEQENELRQLAERVADALRRRGWMLASAESCTGGWLAKVCTDLPGSSAWFERGLVTYSNEAKQDLLGVSAGTLAAHGAVSGQTVREMAEGALARSRAQVSLSISGIAGPGGGSEDKPVGTVWFGWAAEGSATRVLRERFGGDREAVRCAAVAFALRGVLDVLGE